MRLVLRANAVYFLAAGLFLGVATWDWLYSTLGAHKPNPAPFAQLAAIFFVACAYLLWIAPRDVRLTRAVAAACAFANAAIVLLVTSWEVSDKVVLTGRDHVVIVAVAIASGAFAVAEIFMASRSVAMLLPAD